MVSLCFGTLNGVAETLSKEICKRCINRKCLAMKWSDLDDLLWLEGVVICGMYPMSHSLWPIKYKPPANCNFALEHLLDVQK